MTLDDLMAVWRSQEDAPLHGVNRTLLQLALREDQAKLQQARRIERWITYAGGGALAVVLCVFLGMMIATRDRNVMTVWDAAIGMGGAAAALLAAGAMYAGHRAQARRERRFGESLRDQLRRGLAQLDDRATRPRAEMVLVLLGGIGPMALVLLGLRINQMPVRDNKVLVGGMLLMCVGSVAAGIWELRRAAQRELAPRRRRLEALLKDLDGQA